MINLFNAQIEVLSLHKVEHTTIKIKRNHEKITKNILQSIEDGDIKGGVLKLPKSVKGIADKVFQYNDELVKIIGPGIESIGNYNFRFCNALTSVEFPVATSLGNDNFRVCNALTSVEFPVATSLGNDNFYECNALTSAKFGKNNFNVKVVDNYLFVIESKKTSKGIHIYSGYNLYSMKDEVIRREVCFVAEKENLFAHGETVKKAITDVQFKIMSETVKKSPIYMNTTVSVQMYRIITGDCELGCKQWMEQNNIKSNKMKVSKLLPLLEKTSAYGVEKFKSLISE
jgi:hypothetical protein